ncbi:hypothetical protein PHYBOEH_000454 [Phytophthora boehmeriae]|uniref:Pectate lyase domain-containing protein n=1 Tax=Phytophthora boehmeriae TaxID=109152 RepID=A0A8T1VDU0_9STRA|nr:hypothetical protein PHYBOEH_000454 [Phytophthora boehmeriae]
MLPRCRFQCAVFAFVIAYCDLAPAASSVVVGTPPGFAAGTTGGGDIEPVYPTTAEELTTYLSDAEPRVIVLKQEFEFIGTEGSSTEKGCRPQHHLTCLAKKNGFSGQDELQQNGRTCDGSEVEVTYDKAADKPLIIASDKTLVGEGTKGVLNGKGLMIKGNNIIVQNVHVTNLNPAVVFGGDGIAVAGDDDANPPTGIWLDHVKVSSVGRQMVVVHYAGAKQLTISNSDFDGNTKYSSSCDGHHYWGFLILGTKVEMSIVGNYFHATSGRSPKIGGYDNQEEVVHVANNYFSDNTGHAFAVSTGGYVLAEGNYFDSVKTPIEKADPNGHFFVPKAAGDCKASIGRDCELNVLNDSGDFAGYGENDVATKIGDHKTEIGGYAVTAAAKASAASGNFGVGELGSGVEQTSASSGTAAVSTDASGAAQQETAQISPASAATESGSAESPIATTDAPIQQGSNAQGGSMATDNTTSTVIEKCTPRKRT